MRTFPVNQAGLKKMSQAKVLYDFEGVSENGELTIREGQVLTIVNQDVGDGWWEGQLSNGQSGLFPEAYVEIIQTNGVAHESYQHSGYNSTAADGYGNDSTMSPTTPTDEMPTWDDWDDEDQTQDYVNRPTSTGRPGAGGGARGTTTSRGIDDTLGSSSSQTEVHADGRSRTVKRNIYRFSEFVKTGTEAYVLGATAVARKGSPVRENEKIRIVYSGDGGWPMWEPSANPFQCEVRDPEKKKKYHGIKSFVAYTVIPDDTREPVQRRYKHYDWLHERLIHKFSNMSIPPLPDKQYYGLPSRPAISAGRYGEDFLDKRRERLQMWTNRLARHPVISRSEVFRHFLTCTEDTLWKAGKRKAEKDEHTGGALLLTVEHPDIHVELDDAEVRIDHFQQFHTTMTESCTRMKGKFDDHCNKMSGPIMREFHQMAGVFRSLSDCFQVEDEPYAKGLNGALQFTSTVYEELGEMHANQPKNDMLPALDVLKEYLGILGDFPDTQHLAKNAIGKVKGAEKLDGVIDLTELEDIRSRAETVSIALLAEVHHFQHERVVDFKEMMQNLLHAQIKFYQQIVQKLQGALSRYDD